MYGKTDTRNPKMKCVWEHIKDPLLGAHLQFLFVAMTENISIFFSDDIVSVKKTVKEFEYELGILAKTKEEKRLKDSAIIYDH